MGAQSIGPIDTDGTKDSRMNDAITGTEIVIDGGTVRQSEPADRTLAVYSPRVSMGISVID